MGRNKKSTVDYFPHDTKHGQTMFILENKYGNNGYSAWFKLLELLGSTEGHFIDCNKAETMEFMLAKMRISADIFEEIMKTLSNLNAICPILWSKRVVWSDNFVSRISDAYSRRQDKLPDKNAVLSIYVRRNGKNADINPINSCNGTERKEKEKEKEKYRKFKHLSISFEENDKLIKLGYSQKQIDDIYNRIENHKKNTNYSSLYLTSINWLKVQYPNVVKFDTKNKYTEAQIRQAKNYWSMDRILPDFFDKNDLHLLQ